MSCKPTYKGIRYNSLEELYRANQITPEQKQKALELYSQYLENLSTNNIKPGVTELFENDPDFANSVYEALGFNNKVSSKVELKHKIAHVYDIIYNGKRIGNFELPLDLEGSSVLIGDVEIDEKYRGKGLGVETYKAAINLSNKPIISLLATDEANRVWESLVRQGLAEKTENGYKSVKPQITPQQKQKAQQLYSQYLNTIFPDSKVKDIVYHGSKDKIEKFNKPTAELSLGKPAIYFRKDYNKHIKDSKVSTSVIVNSEFPFIADDFLDYQERRSKRVFFDSVYIKNEDEFAVFEPEQIHILGSKQDIQGFKEFVNKPELGDNNIKEGVPELFDSNPELANSVYEALGFKEQQYVSKLKEIAGRRKLATKSDLENSQLIKDIRVNKTQPKTLKPNEADKNLTSIMLYGHRYSDLSNREYIDDNLSTITNPAEMQSEAELLAYRILNDFMFDMDELSFYEDILSESPEYASILSTNENPVKEFFENDIFEQADKEKFEITPEQKQEAQKLYSQYLDTVFPDSKVKDIVYHGTDGNFDIDSKFNKDNLASVSGTEDAKAGFHFTSKFEDANFYAVPAYLRSKTKKVVLPVILNTINQKVLNRMTDLRGTTRDEYNTIGKRVKSFINQGFDSIYLNQYSEGNKADDYIVFEPEQIHILGSKQDIEGFKNWVDEFNRKNKLFQESGSLSTISKSKIDKLQSTIEYQILNEEKDEDIDKKVGQSYIFLSEKDAQRFTYLVEKNKEFPKEFKVTKKITKYERDNKNPLKFNGYNEYVDYYYIKSNKNKKSNLYDIVDKGTGELIASKVRVLSVSKDVKSEIAQKYGLAHIPTKIFNANRSIAFALYRQKPSKAKYIAQAKKYLYDAIKFLNPDETGNYKFNLDKIEELLSNFPEEMWDYINTTYSPEDSTNINASISLQNKIKFDLPKLGLIQELEKITGLKLLGTSFKNYDRSGSLAKVFKHSKINGDWGDTITIDNSMTTKELKASLSYYFKTKNIFKPSSEEENVRKYAEHRNIDYNKLKELVFGDLDNALEHILYNRSGNSDTIELSKWRESIRNYDWQSVELFSKPYEDFQNTVKERITDKFKDKKLSNGISHLEYFFNPGTFNG